MTDTTKLRLKVGPHEFEAEGPEEVVAKYLAIWRDAINRPPDAPAEPEIRAISPTVGDGTPQPDAPSPPDPLIDPEGVPKDRLARLVVFDDRRQMYRLRVIPIGPDAVGDAVLVLLYGALKLRGEDEMLATRLVGALQGSGMTVERVDRDAAMHMRERWVTRYGVGKGGRYRLTSTGMLRAKDVAEALLGQIAG
jgi:hypothetical protein